VAPSRSIESLNIAEGNGKQSLKEKNRFVEIARG
jgi:four helix bundle protein